MLKPLPPFARSIVEILSAGQRPLIFGGAIIAACAWDIARAWPRIVIPDDPLRYRLDFARGLDFLVLAREGHSQEHFHAVVAALRDAGAHIVAPVSLPIVGCHEELDVAA